MRTITFAGPNIVETKNGVRPDQIWSRHKNISQTENGQKIITPLIRQGGEGMISPLLVVRVRVRVNSRVTTN